MTQATPPGWYPDPGQRSDGPPTERWWNGGEWTDRTRAAAAAPPLSAPYPQGAPDILDSAPTGGRRRRLRAATGAVATVVVLACIGGGVYALTSGDGKDGDDAASARHTPSPTPGDGQDGPGGGGGSEPDGEGTPGPDDEPEGPNVPTEKGYATDLASGVAVPVPKGWKGKSGAVGAQLTTGSYPCPGNAREECVRGGVFSQPALVLGLRQTTAKSVARADIEKNAEESYGAAGYGAISSHRELAAKSVDVAGRKGYLVRWKVVTSKGDDGYVESLAFPSPADKSLMVVVRFGFDVNAKAPDVATMDTIAKGIKKARGASGGTGNGRHV